MTRDSNTLRRFWHLIAFAAVLALVVADCGNGGESTTTTGGDTKKT